MQMRNMSGVDVRGFGNKLFICDTAEQFERPGRYKKEGNKWHCSIIVSLPYV